jgi:hypothetical protein
MIGFSNLYAFSYELANHQRPGDSQIIKYFGLYLFGSKTIVKTQSQPKV